MTAKLRLRDEGSKDKPKVTGFILEYKFTDNKGLYFDTRVRFVLACQLKLEATLVGQKKKINTMAELAKALGMSRATLSRYFQDPSTVRGTTRKKIEDALARVDYVPNFFARNMNRQTTKLVGVVVPYLSDLYYTSLIEAIETTARDQDYKVIIQASNNNKDDELQALETLRSMNAAGVIIAPNGANSDVEAINRINRELPLVLVDSDLAGKAKNIPFVGTDNRQSVKLLVDYLCRSGTPPVFLGMPIFNENASQRAMIYADRMVALNHTPEVIEPLEQGSRWDFEDYAYARMKAEFADGNFLTSTILCANDRLAMGAMRAANEASLFQTQESGKDGFRIAGHDDHPLSLFLWPQLTTASQDTKQMGRIAFEMVVERAHEVDRDDSIATDTLLSALFVLRDSA